MKNLTKILTLLSIFFIGTHNCNAEIVKEHIDNITNIYNSQDRLYIINTLKNASPEDKKMFLERAFEQPEYYEPIYLISFCDTYMDSDKNKAALYFLSGFLRSIEDVYMCKDTTARAQISIYPLMAPLTADYISQMPKEELKQIKIQAIEWDKTHHERLSPEWACYHGMSAFSSDTIEILPLKNYSKIQNKVRKVFLK